MKRFILTVSLFACLILGVNQVWALPACPSSGYFDNCYGTYVWDSGSKYVGDWQNGKKHGQGTYTSSFGRQKIGQWKNDKLNGYAKYTIFGFTYQEGIFKDDVFIKKSKLMKKD